MVQIAVSHDWIAEDESKLDQVINGPDVYDRMALMRADHDRTATSDFKLDWDYFLV